MRFRLRLAVIACALMAGVSEAGATPWVYAEAVDDNGIVYGYAQASTVDGHAWLYASCAGGEHPALAVMLDTDPDTLLAVEGRHTTLTYSNDVDAELRTSAVYKAAGPGLLALASDQPATFGPVTALFSAARNRIDVTIAAPPDGVPEAIKFPARGSTNAMSELTAFCQRAE